MSKKLLIVLSLLTLFGGARYLSAGTVATGTTVVVTMSDALSTHERPGRTFRTKLTHDLTAGGKVVVPAGTVFIGVVETSRNSMIKTTTQPLSINLKSAQINGRSVA